VSSQPQITAKLQLATGNQLQQWQPQFHDGRFQFNHRDMNKKQTLLPVEVLSFGGDK